MTSFVVGQRIISDGEASLGLGMIEQVSEQRIQVFFPATEQTRIYSVRSAPITRVRFNLGDNLTDTNNKHITISEIIEQDGILIYRGACDHLIIETQISPLISLNKASDRLLAGQIDPPKWFDLRHQSLELKAKIAQSPLLGLAGSRVQIIAHQLHVAKESSDREQTRVLLADEVGLGKTIEAGLIIKRRILTGRSQRVLILVPANLKHQWLVEMLRKFNLEFTLFDDSYFDDQFLDDEENQTLSVPNPFEQSQLAIVAIEWILQDAKACKALLDANWDLLVVDEAHRLQINGADYILVQQLATQIASVLLLTATPEQLGQESHFARLRLLDGQRFHDFGAYQQELNNYQSVADAVRDFLDNPKLSLKSQTTISKLLDEDKLLQQAMEGDEEAKLRIICQLIDRHGTGRMLFRNTRSAIVGFPGRKMYSYALDLPQKYAEQDLHPEINYAKVNLESKWWYFDPRLEWLIDLLQKLADQKVLIICAHATTAIDLEEALRHKCGWHAAVFHQGMSILERDRAAAFFADDEGSNILICSEIGSEGRNFQFSHNLVLFDLPSHPDLLEQRIGRLDRIGQEHTIQIHIPHLKGAMTRLFEWYQQGLNAFNQTCPSGSALYAKFGDELAELLTQTTSRTWQTFLRKVATEREQLDSALQQGRDRLLEINSSGLGQGEQLATAIGIQDQQTSLQKYMELAFDVFGVDSEVHSEHALILTAGERMLDATFPLFNKDEEAVTITYNRNQALVREDMQFVTAEHPMVLGALDMVLSGSMGNSTVVMLKNKAIVAGTILVEIIFTSEAIAPPALQLERFLTPAPLRCLLDVNNNNLADKVSCGRLSAQAYAVPKVSAQQFIKAQRNLLTNKIASAGELVLEQHKMRVNKAILQLEQEFNEEYLRLKNLQKVNPNVTTKELSAIAYKRKLCIKALGDATLRLDSIRVLVAG